MDAVCDLFPKLRELADRQGGFLSGGEQQMLTIGRTLMGNPELLLLDEPSEGLAPLVVENLLEQVGALKRQGLTILLAEQGVDFSLALADRVYVLEKGSVRFTGPGRRLCATIRSCATSCSRLSSGDSSDRSRRGNMPFVSIKILKGHPQERKDEISRRVTDAISEVAKLPKEAIWVVFEDVEAEDWYVGSDTRERDQEAGARGRPMSVEIRHADFKKVVGDAVEFEKLATGFLFTEGPLWHPRRAYLLFSDMPGDIICASGRLATASRPFGSRAAVERPRLGPQGRLIVLRACESR